MDTLLTGTKCSLTRAISAGLLPLARPEPLRLAEWAAEHFYLSPESSYVQGRWESFPYQVGILNAIGNDDIREVVIVKSARVGYTKSILAAIGYFAEHKKRNQAIWQPVDDDADEFCKTELDPMIRDVPAVQKIFPFYKTRSKHNTLRQKSFSGCMLHIRGGKAAKNYRRISVDISYLDELDGFDLDIEREGDPVTLAGKRVEGSTFPKLVLGSTPKIKGESMIEFRAGQAELSLRFKIPCPHCGHPQYLQWGGKDVQHGFKWRDDDPSTAAYLCIKCAALFTQDQFLEVWTRGRWESDTGVWMDEEGSLHAADESLIDPPLSVAFHVWTAYSPMTSWSQIVREFQAASKDRSKLRAWVNTTLGESWEEEEVERLAWEILHSRREHYRAPVPQGVILLTAGIDTQDDRFEWEVVGWGEGEESWGVDYQRLYGDPSRPQIWARLAELLRRQYRRADGVMMGVHLCCHDFGGHYSDEVADFSKRMGRRWLIPTHGSVTRGRPVVMFPRVPNKRGVYLSEIGTDTAKSLVYQRFAILDPGPGYCHWPVSEVYDEEWFRQAVAEERVRRWERGRPVYVFDAKNRRNEALDCRVLALAAVRVLQQNMGTQLIAQPAVTPVYRPQRQHSEDAGGFGSEDWAL